MIKFYDVNSKYITYLKTIDSKVPNISYSSNNKFVCGVVLNINNIKYYAPVSHNPTIFRTSFGIKDKGKVISTIRFSFMFPAIPQVLTEKDFTAIRKVDANYAALLEKEWRYCIAHESELRAKALTVYKMGCNPNHPMYRNCCKFRELENGYLNFRIS